MLTRSELVRRAGSEKRARTLVARGQWWRVCRDAYAPGYEPDRARVRLAALRRLLPADAALTHRTALWVLGLDVLGPALDVTVPRGRHLVPRPHLRTRSARLDDRELVDLGGLLAVSAARAVVDVARTEPVLEAVAVADAALRAGHATVEGVLESLDRASGLRGVRGAREALALVDPRSESPQESRLRVHLVLGGVPRPVVQHDVYGPRGHVGRADLWIEGLVVEFDGRVVHQEARAFAHDRRRHNEFVELGLEVRRYTGLDVFRRSRADLCAEVWRAVRQAATRSRPDVRPGPDTLPPPAPAAAGPGRAPGRLNRRARRSRSCGCPPAALAGPVAARRRSSSTASCAAWRAGAARAGWPQYADLPATASCAACGPER